MNGRVSETRSTIGFVSIFLLTKNCILRRFMNSGGWRGILKERRIIIRRVCTSFRKKERKKKESKKKKERKVLFRRRCSDSLHGSSPNRITYYREYRCYEIHNSSSPLPLPPRSLTVITSRQVYVRIEKKKEKKNWLHLFETLSTVYRGFTVNRVIE